MENPQKVCKKCQIQYSIPFLEDHCIDCYHTQKNSFDIIEKFEQYYNQTQENKNIQNFIQTQLQNHPYYIQNLEKNLIKGNPIGKGQSAHVFQGRIKETEMNIAIKQFEEILDLQEPLKNDTYQDLIEILNEINILTQINSHIQKNPKQKNRYFQDFPNIIKFFGFSVQKFGENTVKFILLLELSDGNLSELSDQHIENNEIFSFEQILDFFEQLVVVLYQCNNQNISHRDLKPDNILYFKDKNNKIKLKLTDFSEGKLAQQKMQTHTLRGNQPHLSPELFCVLESQEFTRYDPHKNDIYGLGVIIIKLCILKKRPKRYKEIEPPENILGLGPCEEEWQQQFKEIKDKYTKQAESQYYLLHLDSFLQQLEQMISYCEKNRPDAEQILDKFNEYKKENMLKFFQNLEEKIENSEQVKEHREKISLLEEIIEEKQKDYEKQIFSKKLEFDNIEYENTLKLSEKEHKIQVLEEKMTELEQNNEALSQDSIKQISDLQKEVHMQKQYLEQKNLEISVLKQQNIEYQKNYNQSLQEHQNMIDFKQQKTNELTKEIEEKAAQFVKEQENLKQQYELKLKIEKEDNIQKLESKNEENLESLHKISQKSQEKLLEKQLQIQQLDTRINQILQENLYLKEQTALLSEKCELKEKEKKETKQQLRNIIAQQQEKNVNLNNELASFKDQQLDYNKKLIEYKKGFQNHIDGERQKMVEQQQNMNNTIINLQHQLMKISNEKKVQNQELKNLKNEHFVRQQTMDKDTKKLRENYERQILDFKYELMQKQQQIEIKEKRISDLQQNITQLFQNGNEKNVLLKQNSENLLQINKNINNNNEDENSQSRKSMSLFSKLNIFSNNN